MIFRESVSVCFEKSKFPASNFLLPSRDGCGQFGNWAGVYYSIKITFFFADKPISVANDSRVNNSYSSNTISPATNEPSTATVLSRFQQLFIRWCCLLPHVRYTSGLPSLHQRLSSDCFSLWSISSRSLSGSSVLFWNPLRPGTRY